MKTFFWTTMFWLLAIAGFLGYLKWFDADLGTHLISYVVQQKPCTSQSSTNTVVPSNLTGSLSGTINQEPLTLDMKVDEIRQQLKEINEKLEIQNNNTPDAVSISLRTSKKTNVFVWALDGSGYKKYVINPSEDILKDTLNILFTKSAFVLKSTQLDTDGNLTITLERDRNVPFGGSAMVGQVKSAIEKTAMQFSQVKNVNILPDEVIQP